METEIGAMCLQAKERQELLAAARRREREREREQILPRSLQKEPRHRDLRLWPPELWENARLLFQVPQFVASYYSSPRN